MVLVFVYSERLLRWKKLLGSKEGILMPLTYSMRPWLDLIHMLVDWHFVVCWKAMKDLIARMTTSQISLSLISISPLPWDCLYHENMECTSFRFAFLLDSMVHAFTASFLLPGVSKGILSRYLFLVNTVPFFTLISLRNLLALSNVCEGNLDTGVICPSEYLTIFQQLKTHTHQHEDFWRELWSIYIYKLN